MNSCTVLRRLEVLLNRLGKKVTKPMGSLPGSRLTILQSSLYINLISEDPSLYREVSVGLLVSGPGSTVQR